MIQVKSGQIIKVRTNLNFGFLYAWNQTEFGFVNAKIQITVQYGWKAQAKRFQGVPWKSTIMENPL